MTTGTASTESAGRLTDTVAASAVVEPQPTERSQVTKAPEGAAAPEPSAKPDLQPETGSHAGARERTREKLHRASTAARGAIGDNVKRVEKIHHVSSAMIEEAHYDPSLRFVLVALGLFVVFVILLVLTKVMG